MTEYMVLLAAPACFGLLCIVAYFLHRNTAREIGLAVAERNAAIEREINTAIEATAAADEEWAAAAAMTQGPSSQEQEAWARLIAHERIIPTAYPQFHVEMIPTGSPVITKSRLAIAGVRLIGRWPLYQPPGSLVTRVVPIVKPVA